jgi:hypothetical protein
VAGIGFILLVSGIGGPDAAYNPVFAIPETTRFWGFFFDRT